MRIISLRRSILALLVIVAVCVTYTTNYGMLLRDFEMEAHERSIQINRYIELSRTFIDLMTIYGNEYFRQSKDMETELYEYIQYDMVSDSFNLDSIKGTKFSNSSGNLTGEGKVPIKGINRDELNLALKYNEFFNDFHDRLEGVQWLYYTSENGFINLFPWVPSKEFAYFRGIKNFDFYSRTNPHNNPYKQAIWSPVHMDHAGKGMVVTLSSPIYNGGIFMGVISLDILADKLRELISTEYESYLVDHNNIIIATDSPILPGQVPVNFLTVLEEYQVSITEPETAGVHDVHRSGRYYVHSFGFDRVPWILHMMVPADIIVYKASVASLPVLLIGILLVYAMYEYERSKRTGQLLQNSLAELKSYQKLLENAAKLDMLTNTYNRRGMKENFRSRVDGEAANNTLITFIIGDIDNFKQFNDTFGHAAGDKVLVAIAETIRQNVGDDGIVCRWGGEEFVLVLYGKSYEEAMAVAESIRSDVEKMSIPWENDMLLKGTMTFGVAEYDYSDTIEGCVSKADCALYLGKENGRNQVKGYRDVENAEN